MTFGTIASSHPLAASGYEAAVLTDSPYAYYRLNDSSGNPADSSGNSRNATGVNSAPTYHTTGGPVSGGGYMTFDGVDDYVTLGNVDDWVNGQTQCSVEYWIRTTTAANATVLATLNDGANTAVQAKVNRSADDGSVVDGAVSLYLRDEDDVRKGKGTLPTGGAPDIGDGSWHHVVISYDYNAGSDIMAIYIDGTAYTTGAGEANDYETSFGQVDNMTSFQYDLLLGARNLRGTVDTHIAADIAEVALYRTYINSTQASNHYNAA